MSWSFAAVGTPAAVVGALDVQNAGLTGPSVAEWQEAKPALAALVGANVGTVAVRVTASGHAAWTDGVKTSGQCSCLIETLYGWVA